MPINTATSILGFPVPDKIAKTIEDAHKALPSDVRDLFHASIKDASGTQHSIDGYCRKVMTPKSVDFNDGERADVSVITSDAVDADREIVAPEGLDWSIFQKSPAVALDHNYTIPRVGKCLWIKTATLDDGATAWKAKTAFTPRPSDYPSDQEWLPETAWFYVREGCLPAKSIGFIPMSIKSITADDIRQNPKMKDAKYVINKAMVLEYSVCMLGANPDSLVEACGKMKAKGIQSKSLTDALGIIIPDEIVVTKTVETPIIVETKIEPEPVVEKKVIKSFVSPETLLKSAERIALNRMGDPKIAKRIQDSIIDRLDKAMGKV